MDTFGSKDYPHHHIDTVPVTFVNENDIKFIVFSENTCNWNFLLENMGDAVDEKILVGECKCRVKWKL